MICENNCCCHAFAIVREDFPTALIHANIRIILLDRMPAVHTAQILIIVNANLYSFYIRFSVALWRLYFER